MKKKMLAIALAAVAAVGAGALAGCGGTGDGAAYITSAIAREAGSGTRGAFDELVKNTEGTTIDGALASKNLAGCVSETNSTAAVITEVGKSTTALGYISLGSVAANTGTIKAVKVEGVEATTENILNGSYVLSRPFNIVYKSYEELSALAKDFISYITGTEGQTIVEEEGYIALTAEKSSYVQSQEPLSGTISIDGSTSVQPLILKLAAAYMQINSGVTVNIQGGGSSVGIADAQSGSVDFGMASRELKQSEAASLTSYKIADDGIAVIVSKSCPLTNVTLDELYNLYINGTKIEAK